MNLRKKVCIGLGLLISSIVVGLLLSFPYNLPIFIGGIIIFCLMRVNYYIPKEKCENISLEYYYEGLNFCINYLGDTGNLPYRNGENISIFNIENYCYQMYP